MKIDILTLFPGMFKGVVSESIIKRAREKEKVEIKVHNLRKWTDDRHRTADDKPFGGGSGMVMKIEPVYKALKSLLKQDPCSPKAKGKTEGTNIILLTPQGKRLDQKLARALSVYKYLVLICGHYEGVDERIRNLVTEEVSIGDYILTGGEIPAMVLIDSVIRFIPGVLGEERSLLEESFESNLLEYPQYTRPRVFRGMGVPDDLLSGDHKKIEKWRREQALKRTKEVRPDLLSKEKQDE